MHNMLKLPTRWGRMSEFPLIGVGAIGPCRFRRQRNGVKKTQRKRRKKTKKAELADESAPATPAESAKQMVTKQRGFSKKIDYSAMDRFFADD